MTQPDKIPLESENIEPPIDLNQPITEDWLKASGFLWQQHDRQPEKQWLLWLGDAVRENEDDGRNLTSFEDIGIEVAPNARTNSWFCWLRSDAASKYGRFIHTRHMATRLELVRLVEALTNQPWQPHRHIHGLAYGEKGFNRMIEYADRADVRMLQARLPYHAWHDIERDPYKAGANSSTLRELADRKAES